MEDNLMLNTKKAVTVVIVCLLITIIIAVVTTPAYAQKGDKDSLGADKDLASRKGISGSLATKQFDKDKLPGKWKIGFAIGSVITAIAVVKWL